MAGRNLPDFRPGDKFSDLSANDMQNLVRAVASRMNIRGAHGSGIAVRTDDFGVVIDARIPDQQPRQIIDTTWVFVRNIPDPDQYVLEVEYAVAHSDFAGDNNPDNLHRFVPMSEFPWDGQGEPPPPMLTDMSVWPHWKAVDYDLLLWPVGAPSSREADVLRAELVADRRGVRGWHVKPDVRMYLRKFLDSASIGSCSEWEDLA